MGSRAAILAATLGLIFSPELASLTEWVWRTVGSCFLKFSIADGVVPAAGLLQPRVRPVCFGGPQGRHKEAQHVSLLGGFRNVRHEPCRGDISGMWHLPVARHPIPRVFGKGWGALFLIADC